MLSRPNPPLRLFDEHDAVPFPGRFAKRLAAADELDVALTRLRVLALVMRSRDIRRLARIRLCVARAVVGDWEVEVRRALLDDVHRDRTRALVEALKQRRIEVRSAPLHGWSPDFSVFSEAGSVQAALLGSHWLDETPPDPGPLWAVEAVGGHAAPMAVRFDELWDRAHDVSAALCDRFEWVG